MKIQTKRVSPRYQQLRRDLAEQPRTWLVTGVAGFIGCNLLLALLELGQRVVGVDNFSTGSQENLRQIRAQVGVDKAGNFTMIEGDIRDLDVCRSAVAGVDYVLHQAALGSVPRSLENPILVNGCNVDGFLNVLVASRDEGVTRLVYAASSSTYGDHPDLPKVEDVIGKPLSPYAVTKLVNELYADVFARSYSFGSIGLRYFNVFGPHQSPEGAYAAVIPRWISAMLRGHPVEIYGDGETSRDFCFVANAVQANLLAAMAASDAVNQIYNVGVGDRTTLNELHQLIAAELKTRLSGLKSPRTLYRDFRVGDVRHSLASIKKARELLGYVPTHGVGDGLREAMDWYVRDLGT